MLFPLLQSRANLPPPEGLSLPFLRIFGNHLSVVLGPLVSGVLVGHPKCSRVLIRTLLIDFRGLLPKKVHALFSTWQTLCILRKLRAL